MIYFSRSKYQSYSRLFLIDAARRNGDERSEESNRVAFELKQNREGEGSKMTFRNFFIKTFTRFAKISED